MKFQFSPRLYHTEILQDEAYVANKQHFRYKSEKMYFYSPYTFLRSLMNLMYIRIWNTYRHYVFLLFGRWLLTFYALGN